MCDMGQAAFVGGEDEVNPRVYRRAEWSPYRAFLHRVHRGTLRTVENTGKLIKLGHTANHSVGRENTNSLVLWRSNICDCVHLLHAVLSLLKCSI